MPFNLGPLEIVIIAVIAILIFGPKTIGALSRKAGAGFFQYKKEVNELKQSLQVDVNPVAADEGAKVVSDKEESIGKN